VSSFLHDEKDKLKALIISDVKRWIFRYSFHLVLGILKRDERKGLCLNINLSITTSIERYRRDV